MQQKYGKSQAELKEFCKTLSEVAYVKEKGEVTCEEWLNWIKLDQSEGTTSQTQNFIKTHSKFREWEDLFFKLSNGSMEIDTNELEKYIKDTEDVKVIFLKPNLNGRSRSLAGKNWDFKPLFETLSLIIENYKQTATFF